MAKKPIDYSKAVLYKIFNRKNSNIYYIGYTTNFTEKKKIIRKKIKYSTDELYFKIRDCPNEFLGIEIIKKIPKNDKLGKAVVRQYGKAANGFDIASCQFALHYFFENNDILQGFMRNVAECVKLGGYFIGTCYDGSKIFEALKDKKQGDHLTITENGDIKVWDIVKEYDSDVFVSDETSLGYAINVYQETINKYFREYLVNVDYLVRVMENYGFKPLTQSEAKEHGLPSGIGNFKQLYTPKYKMKPDERTISFYNTYFAFKKIRTLDAEKVKLENSDESIVEAELNKADTLKIRKPKKTKKKLVITTE